MKAFKDKNGRDWAVSITYGTLDQIAEELGDDLIEDPTSISLHPRKWIHMLAIACKDQYEDLDLTPQEFSDLFTGAILRDAMNAFMLELSDFFSPLHPAQGEVMKKVWEALNQSREAQGDFAKEVFAKQSLDLLEWLASNPGDINSGNSDSLPTEPTPNLKKPTHKKRKRKPRGRR